ncbi:hypothetical protein KXS07_37090 [Inquilinus limosus]|uniref:hypothetical protein n=1 Tax=Inquilinus limosus TaxID=171674 RepID=UPI003F15FAFC
MARFPRSLSDARCDGASLSAGEILSPILLVLDLGTRFPALGILEDIIGTAQGRRAGLLNSCGGPGRTDDEGVADLEIWLAGEIELTEGDFIL